MSSRRARIREEEAAKVAAAAPAPAPVVEDPKAALLRQLQDKTLRLQTLAIELHNRAIHGGPLDAHITALEQAWLEVDEANKDYEDE
jgi:hypothetical protein